MTAPPVPAGSLRLCQADLATFLESGPPARFAAFSLSNLEDVLDPAGGARLCAAVQHAAAPGAVVVSRSFGMARDAEEAEWAARDRSFLWGSLRVHRLRGHRGPRSPDLAVGR